MSQPIKTEKAKSTVPIELFDCTGQRKYLTGEESQRFHEAANPFWNAMAKQLLYSIIILCILPRLNAQKTTPDSLRVPSNLKIAYNASIIYPGLRFGGEYPIKQFEVTKYRRHKSARHFTQYRYLSLEFAGYHHPTFHDNLYLLAGWQMRRQHPRGFFTEFSPALGYSRTFLGGETYQVDEFGNISLRKLAGYNYGMVAIGGGCGYKIRPNTSLYLRASLLTMFPSNNIVYLRPTLDLGVIWTSKSLWVATIHPGSKTKGRHP